MGMQWWSSVGVTSLAPGPAPVRPGYGILFPSACGECAAIPTMPQLREAVQSASAASSRVRRAASSVKFLAAALQPVLLGGVHIAPATAPLPPDMRRLEALLARLLKVRRRASTAAVPRARFRASLSARYSLASVGPKSGRCCSTRCRSPSGVSPDSASDLTPGSANHGLRPGRRRAPGAQRTGSSSVPVTGCRGWSACGLFVFKLWAGILPHCLRRPPRPGGLRHHELPFAMCQT